MRNKRGIFTEALDELHGQIAQLETEKTAMIEGLNDIRHELHEWAAHNPILERVLLQTTRKLYELANRPVPPENKQ